MSEDTLDAAATDELRIDQPSTRLNGKGSVPKPLELREMIRNRDSGYYSPESTTSAGSAKSTNCFRFGREESYSSSTMADFTLPKLSADNQELTDEDDDAVFDLSFDLHDDSVFQTYEEETRPLHETSEIERMGSADHPVRLEAVGRSVFYSSLPLASGDQQDTAASADEDDNILSITVAVGAKTQDACSASAESSLDEMLDVQERVLFSHVGSESAPLPRALTESSAIVLRVTEPGNTINMPVWYSRNQLLPRLFSRRAPLLGEDRVRFFSESADAFTPLPDIIPAASSRRGRAFSESSLSDMQAALAVGSNLRRMCDEFSEFHVHRQRTLDLIIKRGTGVQPQQFEQQANNDSPEAIRVPQRLGFFATFRERFLSFH